MGKIKQRRPVGIEKRRHTIALDDISEVQQRNRAQLLGYVNPGDIARFYEVLTTEAFDNRKPWAMQMFAQQLLGPVKTEHREEVVDVAKLLRVAAELREEVVDAEIIE